MQLAKPLEAKSNASARGRRNVSNKILLVTALAPGAQALIFPSMVSHWASKSATSAATPWAIPRATASSPLKRAPVSISRRA